MAFTILDYLKTSFLPQQQPKEQSTGTQIGVGSPAPQAAGMDISEAQKFLELTPEEQRAYALNELLKGKGASGASGRQDMTNQFIQAGYSAYHPTSPDTSMFYQNKWSPPQISKLSRSI